MHAPDLALPLALGTGVGVGARTLARSAALLARLDAIEVELMLDTEDGLGKVELELHPQIGAALGCRAPRRCAAEEGVEDVAETSEALEPLEALRLAAIDTGGAEAIVAAALLRVGEHLVGASDLLEATLRALRLVAVGVVLHRELAESALDLVLRGLAGYAQHLVEVVLGRHEPSASWQRPAALGYSEPLHSRLCRRESSCVVELIERSVYRLRG